MSLLRACGVKHNNLKPREMESAARSAGVSEPILAKYRRLSASHTNALESFPILVAALVCGNFAGLRGRVMNTYALGYAVLRIGYNYAYARQETRVVAGMRTVCFWVGTLWSFWIVVESANVLRLKRA